MARWNQKSTDTSLATAKAAAAWEGSTAVAAAARASIRHLKQSDMERMRQRRQVARLRAELDRIGIPLLVVQGRNDPRVPASESEQIVNALRNNGQTVWYIEALNEGHGYDRKENRDIYEQATILFLQQHLAD